MAVGPAFREVAAELFSEFHHELRARVRSRVRTSDANIDDACAEAWRIFLRRQPEHPESFRGWLIVVATRLAIELAVRDRRVVPLVEGRTRNPSEIRMDIVSELHVTDAARMEVKEALERVAELKPLDRHVFVLHVLGYTYDEIADLMSLTESAVDRYLRRARAHVRGASKTPKRGPRSGKGNGRFVS